MSSPARAKLVLYVEDEVLIQELIREALEEAGYAVFLASSGREAVQALDDPAADFWGLVTDVNLPENISGWDVARRAREVLPTLPVIYVTGDSAHQWTSLGAPNSLVLVKPFAPAQLVVALSNLLNQAETGG